MRIFENFLGKKEDNVLKGISFCSDLDSEIVLQIFIHMSDQEAKWFNQSSTGFSG